jgi:hypothetical protein
LRLQAALGAFQADDISEYLRPYHRFALGVALRLTSHQWRADAGPKTLMPDAVWQRSIPRDKLLPPDRDPIHLLTQLGINRFLTTNYDQEIEHLLRDIGARPRDKGAHEDSRANSRDRDDPLGQPLRQLVFDRDGTSELLAFAARDRGRGVEVVHLHGLAVPDGHIIATEADYADRYLSADDRRSLMDDAVSAAFAASPLLFVGSGFSEDDLLRPLRHFLGGRPRLGERNAVALLPWRSDSGKTEMEAIRDLQRYGVYVIHYGREEAEPPGTWPESGKEPWLQKLTKAHDQLKRALDGIGRWHSTPKVERATIATIRRQLQEAADIKDLAKPKRLEGIDVTARPALDIAAEVGLFTTSIAFLNDLISLVPKDAALERKLSEPAIRTLAFAHLAAIKGALDSITGAFLCASLIRLHEGRLKWQRRWARLPKHGSSNRHICEWLTETPSDPRHAGIRPQRRLALHGGHPDQLLDNDKFLDWMTLHRRHPTVHPSVPDQMVEPRMRFTTDAPSQAFNSFISALDANRALRQPHAGRRIFMILGGRGSGKGNFFGALQSPTRIGPFLEAIGAPATKWPSGTFLNLSFAHEVTSAFDLLAHWLLANADKHGKDRERVALIKREFDSLRSDRVGRLQFILGQFGSGLFAPHERWLVAINGLQIMLDVEGCPKNAQLARLLDCLLGAPAAKAPIDLLLVCSSEAVPSQVRRGEAAATRRGGPIVELRRPELSEKDTAKLDHYGRHLDLQPATLPLPATIWGYVHFLRQSRAAVLASAFFPSVALAIGHAELLSLQKEPGGSFDSDIIDLLESLTPSDDKVPNVFSPHLARAIRSDVSRALNRWTGIGPFHKEVTLGVQTRAAQSLIAAGIILLHSGSAWSEKNGLKWQAIEWNKVPWPDILTQRESLARTDSKGARLAREDLPDPEKEQWRFANDTSAERALHAMIGWRLSTRINLSARVMKMKKEKRHLDEVVPLEDDDLHAAKFEAARLEVALLSLFDRLTDRINNRFLQIARDSGKGRYTLTLLFCGAYQHLLPLAEGKKSPVPYEAVSRAMQSAAGWLRAMTEDMAQLSVARRDDFVIGRALSLMDDLYKIDLPLDAGPVPSDVKAILSKIHIGEDRRLLFGDRRKLVDLQRQVLWHIAAIGQPVEAEVLLRCPRILESLKRALCEKVEKFINDAPASGQPPYAASTADELDSAERIRLFALECVLLILEARCLIFRLHRRDKVVGERNDTSALWSAPDLQQPVDAPPQPMANAQMMADTAGRRMRWAIHRLVQRHIFHRMGAPFVEYTRPEQFTLTLYASQPDELPRLTTDAHADLHRTVSALVGYPEARDQGQEIRARKKERAHISAHTTAIECLRAAFGIVRSTYSLSVISRLDSTTTQTGEAGIASLAHRGFFEAHRLLLRWMAHEARWLEDIAEEQARTEEEQARTAVESCWKHAARPFYAEELVWLYNECGVLSLVQGRVTDAMFLLDRADLMAANELEPQMSGGLRARISLNRALANIDRGRLSLAQEELEHVRGIHDETPDMRLIATGFLGVVEHLRGRMPQARAHYAEALEGTVLEQQSGRPGGLLGMRRSRAAAIFARCMGDLHQRLQKTEDAQRSYTQAFTLALEGGHEDVRHAIMVARMRARIRTELAGGAGTTSAEMAERHRELDVVEDYARLMGLLRLHTEVDEVRARLHRLSGDLPAAAAVAARSVAIASANDLRLRKTSLLIELAHVQLARDMHRECHVLLLSALDTARDTHYHSAYLDAQELLAKVTWATASRRS